MAGFISGGRFASLPVWMALSVVSTTFFCIALSARTPSRHPHRCIPRRSRAGRPASPCRPRSSCPPPPRPPSRRSGLAAMPACRSRRCGPTCWRFGGAVPLSLSLRWGASECLSGSKTPCPVQLANWVRPLGMYSRCVQVAAVTASDAWPRGSVCACWDCDFWVRRRCRACPTFYTANRSSPHSSTSQRRRGRKTDQPQPCPSKNTWRSRAGRVSPQNEPAAVSTDMLCPAAHLARCCTTASLQTQSNRHMHQDRKSGPACTSAKTNGTSPTSTTQRPRQLPTFRAQRFLHTETNYILHLLVNYPLCAPITLLMLPRRYSILVNAMLNAFAFESILQRR
jgi:hypothetical protein